MIFGKLPIHGASCMVYMTGLSEEQKLLNGIDANSSRDELNGLLNEGTSAQFFVNKRIATYGLENMDPKELIDELHRIRAVAALEAFNIPTINPAELLSRILPAISTNVQGFVGFFSPSAPPIELPREYRKFIAVLDKQQYVDLVPLQAFVPEGMDTDYLQYVSTLQESVEYAVKAMDRLNTFSTYAAMVLTNAAYNTPENNIKAYKGMETLRNQLNKDLGSCFEQGSSKSETTYGKVIKRNRDWDLTLSIINHCVLAINKVNRKDLNAKVAETSMMLEKLVKQSKAGNMSNVGSDVVMELAEGSYQVARELEFFAIIYYRVMAASAQINRTIDFVTKVVNK